MHDFVHHFLVPFLQLVADPSSSSSSSPGVPQAPTPPSHDNTVKVAIVTTLGLVFATSITAIASTFRRASSAHSTVAASDASDNFTKRYISGLEKDRRELGKIREVYSLLRESCIDRGLNPDHLIMEQERVRRDQAEQEG